MVCIRFESLGSSNTENTRAMTFRFCFQHHCRNCGDIFCDKCTQGRTALTADENAAVVKVCDRCMEEMERNRRESSGKWLSAEIRSRQDCLGRMKEVACPTCTVHLQVDDLSLKLFEILKARFIFCITTSSTMQNAGSSSELGVRDYRIPSSLFNGRTGNSFLVFGCEAKVQLPNNLVVKAVFAFGDSIVDQGNNNDIATVVKCNFLPYGKDFNGGIPTGRFCNGKTPPDLIVEELGIKELVPAYLDSNLKSEDLKTGVSFASGGCGFNPLTATIVSAIPLSTQLNQFREYIGKLEGLVGEEESNYILENSLFLVVAGSDDLANTYFTAGIRLKQDIDSYTDLMVEKASEFIQDLKKLRKGVVAQEQ
ncbi:hypothetical protein RND71_031733 [Anisodus tanguticus]|uniref:FYVE-type domain-containing protein n=1 Tax=Anisodus tanguticus TaxID=243964 RepID=A0AAE1RD37_9SOLA|nr:hypothetical protein RND71_031733 [Anisodus tanguticus]